MTTDWDALFPLRRFSTAMTSQVLTLRRLGQEALTLMDARHSRGYDLFWLCTLGAYEVVRTMSDHLDCFSPPMRAEILRIKERLTTIRMPFAKHQLARKKGDKKKVPLRHELAIKLIGPDLGWAHEIEGEIILVRELMEDVLKFFATITPDMIVNPMPIREKRPTDNF